MVLPAIYRVNTPFGVIRPTPPLRFVNQMLPSPGPAVMPYGVDLDVVMEYSEPDPVWWTSGYNKTLVLSVRPSFFVLFRSSRIAVDTVEQEVP